jgi:uncharacterized protein YgiM (DUF1202 family)
MIKFFYYIKIWCNINCLTAVLFLLTLFSSCTTAPLIPPGKNEFYVIPEITYLRESPGYEEKVLSQLNRGDQVIVLENGEASWWRVLQVPGGQTGWLQKGLLSSVPVPSNFYYVNQNKISLLACPKNDCPALTLLSRGDRVTKLDEQSSGWWRVQAVASGVQGWLPAAALSENLADAKLEQPSKEYYYVAVKNLGLRSKPWINDTITKTLEFNQQVQKISQNSQGWFKVRLPGDGSQGWVQSLYLEQLPSVAPRPLPTKNKPKNLPRRKELPTEPEVM